MLLTQTSQTLLKNSQISSKYLNDFNHLLAYTLNAATTISAIQRWTTPSVWMQLLFAINHCYLANKNIFDLEKNCEIFEHVLAFYSENKNIKQSSEVNYGTEITQPLTLILMMFLDNINMLCEHYQLSLRHPLIRGLVQ